MEGLSIAAICYYVISLLLYAGKAVKAAGFDIQPELIAGLFIPLVLWSVWSVWSVWSANKKIQDRLYKRHGRDT